MYMKTFNQILSDYTRLVEKLANSYSINDIDIIKDIEQEGNIGLWTAYNKYDEAKGPFTSFAILYIKKYQLEYLRDNLKTIRIPSHVQKLINKDIYETKSGLRFECNIGIVSMNIQTGTETSILEDFLGEDNQSIVDDSEELKSIVLPMLNRLKTKDLDYIQMYYGFAPYEKEYTLREIGDKYGVSHEAVRIKLRKIEKQMKNDITTTK